MTVLPPPPSGSSLTAQTETQTALATSLPWLNFRHPAVRDLVFVLASPPLLTAWPNDLQPESATPIDLFSTSFWHSHYQRYLPQLLALDQYPAPLEHALAAVSSTRLGVRFETLLSFWLKDKSGDWHDFVLLAQNIQLKDHKRTIGEIDFLIKNQDSGEIEHWELSLKFYLGEADLTPFNWRGLNDRDSFGRKIKHTVSHQFNVSEVQHTTLGTLAIQRRRAVFKGRLFYPDAHLYRAQDLAATRNWLHPAHLRGSWGYDLPTQLDWRRAARREWLTPLAQPSVVTAPPYLSHGLYLGFTSHTDAPTPHPAAMRMIRVMPQHAPYLATFYTRLYTSSLVKKSQTVIAEI